MRHKGVHYTLTLIGPGLWRWQFLIAGKVKTGRTRANMVQLAARRVAMIIDREQRMRMQRKARKDVALKRVRE